MALWLLDTNVLLRAMDRSSGQVAQAGEAMQQLVLRGNVLCVTSQVIIEFWTVATRAPELNGLGLQVPAVAAEVESILSRFTLLEDTEKVFPIWLDLVRAHQRTGKQVHDARIVAVMKAHGVQNLLTFNVGDFAAYGEIEAVHPRDVK
jgi:predicted nucleic acid-binding protein